MGHFCLANYENTNTLSSAKCTSLPFRSCRCVAGYGHYGKVLKEQQTPNYVTGGK
jgi:hypothetical protein